MIVFFRGTASGSPRMQETRRVTGHAPLREGGARPWMGCSCLGKDKWQGPRRVRDAVAASATPLGQQANQALCGWTVRKLASTAPRSTPPAALRAAPPPRRGAIACARSILRIPPRNPGTIIPVRQHCSRNSVAHILPSRQVGRALRASRFFRCEPCSRRCAGTGNLPPASCSLHDSSPSWAGFEGFSCRVHSPGI